MKGLPLFSPLSIATLVIFLSAMAQADSIQVTLTQSTLSGTAGSTLTFDATLTNLSTSTVFLNADIYAISPGLTVDDNPFLNNAPVSLAAGQSSGTFAIFDVIIAAGTAPGVYSLNTFTILGGADGNASNQLGSTSFTVDVLSPAPEPGTLLLVGSGLLGLATKRRFRRHTRNIDSDVLG